jgi:NADH-quinone oxidoreductase subunit N
MNALILSALSGVIMMFSGFMLKSNTSVRTLAIILLTIIIGATLWEMKAGALVDVTFVA